MSIGYADSLAVGAADSRQALASKLPIGERFFSAQVVSQASATADQLTTRIPFTGAWQVLVFAGDVSQPAAMDRLRKLADYLDSPESIVSKYTPPDRKRWDVVRVVTIRGSCALEPDLSAAFRDTDFCVLLPRLRPTDLPRAIRFLSAVHLPPAPVRPHLRR